jgi:hypothetical protein|tara:strand:- start:47 stop:268 length:222 start_codon:yes stop_codon:yes gene_type:complete
MGNKGKIGKNTHLPRRRQIRRFEIVVVQTRRELLTNRSVITAPLLQNLVNRIRDIQVPVKKHERGVVVFFSCV